MRLQVHTVLILTLGLFGAIRGVAGCSQDQETRECPNEEISVEGHLRLMGNEPFVRTAVITADDKRYLLHADPQLIDTLWQARSKLEITGRCLDDHEFTPPGIYIEVRSWKPVNNP